MIIPLWAVARWSRQANTAFCDLPADEQETDRKEADKFIKLIRRLSEMEKRFVLEIKPAIPPTERHKIESALEKLGYKINGAGQTFDGEISDITFSKDD
jgi:hypothetical protein